MLLFSSPFINTSLKKLHHNPPTFSYRITIYIISLRTDSSDRLRQVETITLSFYRLTCLKTNSTSIFSCVLYIFNTKIITFVYLSCNLKKEISLWKKYLFLHKMLLSCCSYSLTNLMKCCNIVRYVEDCKIFLTKTY